LPTTALYLIQIVNLFNSGKKRLAEENGNI